ncbi:SOS response-associated peptidase [Sphingomonas sp. GM_Shp_2]|uniref:SOS response-associated peptidase n=1 Tax=Sphingomonas sp. GM_Shp_2 TaxID=2937380 RepID=UPI002269B2A8|nr:SOS response-associated peptidase [Sphingomonas sp. GM_Shp_2]
MCTNYRRTKGFDEIGQDFREVRIPLRFPEPHMAPNLEPQSEIRPTDRAIVLRPRDDGVELTWMRWGLLPFFYKGPIKGWKAATFNARAEGVKTAASFREPFKRRRCLIAAEGWVEWKGEGKPKPKFFVAPRDAAPICLAGLWDRATTLDAGEVESFTMVTQPPGALSDLHDRAPVVLRQENWGRWLDPDRPVDDLLATEPPNLFRIRPFHEVSGALL